MLGKPAASQSLPARKQLATLGQFIVLVFIAAIFFRLRIVESIHHTENFQAIAALASLTKSPIHKALVGRYDSDDKFRQAFDLSVQDAFMAWLKQYHGNKDNLHRLTRQSLTEWLRKNGLSISELSELSGKGFNERYPFLPFRSSMPPFDSDLKNDADVDHNPSIELLLEEIRHLSSPTTFSIATGLRDSELPKLNFSLSQNRMGNGYNLDSIVLSDKSELVMTFVENTGVSQVASEVRKLHVPVVLETIKGVDLLSMLSRSKNQKQFEILRSNKTAFEHLLLPYGKLPIEQGKQISGQRMLVSYQDVDMFGFKFSPRHFWIFIFVFNLIFLLTSIVHILFPDGKNEKESMTLSTNILIGNKLIRILLWCLLPISSMLLTYPRQPWSFFTAVVYWGTIAILVALGIKVYVLTKAAETSNNA